ncbi:MAG: M20/M25/M40 family metallo-hydrolase [Prevotellaceae bacterium]|jgi:acetylornithine deacetylase|nr:M20/M25/M40 family metallo-hydrolase [Prevotellaceae bacterium]
MLNATTAIQLLQALIATPSVSREEEGTARIIFDFLQEQKVSPKRYLNNVYSLCERYDAQKPTLLLCSHHDTVRPAAGYTRDPFAPTIEDGKLYGLGSNDAGASVAALAAVYCNFYRQPLPFNLALAIVAEEEVQGPNGVEAIKPLLGDISCAIVGEPTQMQAAVGERGLMVLDCTAHGKQGHAARGEGDNALYRAIDAIEWIRAFRFPKISERMGEVKMTVTMMSCGTQHNVIPAECKFVVDVRPTDAYDNQEIVDIIRAGLPCDVQPRSTRILASSIADSHPLVQTALMLGRKTYVSPTTSDIALLRLPSLKMGPGSSSRSHSADEYVYLSEVEEAIGIYEKMIEGLAL